MFAGNDAAAFRELYDDLAWLFDALKDRELDEDDEEGPGNRTVFVADRIMREPLRLACAATSNGLSVIRMTLLWSERGTTCFDWSIGGSCGASEVRTLLVGFQGFLAFVGAEHLGFERWKHVVRGISEIPIHLRPAPERVEEK